MCLQRERDGVFVLQNIMKLNPALCPQDAGRLKYGCLGKVQLIGDLFSYICFQLNSLCHIPQSSCQDSQAVKTVNLSRLSSCQGSPAVKAVKLSRQSICLDSQAVKAVKLSWQSNCQDSQTVMYCSHKSVSRMVLENVILELSPNAWMGCLL